MFESSLNAMLALFICMLIGYVATKKKVLTSDMLPVLNKLLLYIAFPIMIISILNIELTNNILIAFPIVFSVAITYNLILWGLAVLLCFIFKIRNNKGILIFSFIFSNVAFIGFPLIEAIYGTEALVYLTIFNIVFNILVFTFGVYLLQENSKRQISLKKILLTPSMIGIWIGLFLLFSQLVFPGTFENELGRTRLPYFISNALNIIGAMTSPLAMIIVGISLVQTDMKKVFTNIQLHLFSIISLIIAPFIIYLILNLLLENMMLINITTILVGLPTATISVSLAEEFNLDYIFVSEVVFISTLYSVVTIPFLCYLIA